MRQHRSPVSACACPPPPTRLPRRSSSVSHQRQRVPIGRLSTCFTSREDGTLTTVRLVLLGLGIPIALPQAICQAGIPAYISKPCASLGFPSTA
jgi:hypothetical protein